MISCETIRWKDCSFCILGRDDIQGDPQFGKKIKDIFPNLPGNQFRIMLDHRPVRITENAKIAQLQLSGHTHGGQLLGFDALVAAANDGYVRGWYTVKNTQMYVSNGTGLWSGFPIRFGIPAEIAILTLFRQV